VKKQGQLRTLKLSRETLRNLEPEGLAKAIGGTTFSCAPTCLATSCAPTCQDTCANSCLEYNTCFCGGGGTEG
jgi:hypothetical protein